MPELHEHNWHEIDEYYDECVLCGATRHTYEDDDYENEDDEAAKESARAIALSPAVTGQGKGAFADICRHRKSNG